MDPSGDPILQPVIRIRRRATLVDRGQDYTIVRDGRRVGVIRDGEQREIALAPGAHRLHLEGWRWHRSEPADVVMDTGAVDFECGPSPTRSNWARWPEGMLGDLLMDLLALVVRDPARDQIVLGRAAGPDAAHAGVGEPTVEGDERSSYVRLMDVVEGRD